MDEQTRKHLLDFQEGEITEHHIYRRIARHVPDEADRRVLEGIADDELRHYHTWRELTGSDVKPRRLRIWWYSILNLLFGYTFAIKLLESGEEAAQLAYGTLLGDIPSARAIIDEEDEHEQALIAMLDEERLRYTGSMVLGLSDALVELTGALAGLTLALQNTGLIALTGLITGIAASLSMAASEYLSTKTENDGKHPLKAAVYTGIAYVLTVCILILPYLVLSNYYVCLAFTLSFAVIIIAVFNYYVAVAQDQPFKSRFLEMTGLSMGVAGLSFVIGFIIRAVLGVDV